MKKIMMLVLCLMLGMCFCVPAAAETYEYTYSVSGEAATTEEVIEEDKPITMSLLDFLIDNATDIILFLVVLIALIVVGHRRNQIADS